MRANVIFMRRLAFLILVSTTALPLAASAQLSVQLRMQRETFLRYESVPVTVSIRNFSGRPVQLRDSESRPWLDFVVADERGGLIGAVGKRAGEEPLAIAAGQTLIRTIDLLPIYDLRTRGNFQVQAVVEMDGARTISQPVRFTIVHGRELWSQTVGLPTTGSNDEYRTYSLMTRREQHYDLLYVCVEDRKSELVYGALPLGVNLADKEPEVRLDKMGHLYVLFRTGPRAYAYAHVDPQARILDRAAYSDLASEPRLVADTGGNVAVSGGEKTYPRDVRMTNEPEVKPTPPPVPQKPKKSWWPFGRPKPSAESSPSNSPSSNFRPR
jgi:hypothetical protein